VQAISIPGRRFICGVCGVRGIIPGGFQGGQLRCGSCGQQLDVGRPKRRSAAPAVFSVALVLAAGLAAAFFFGVFDEGEGLRQAAERLGISEAVRAYDTTAKSPQEASIRAHSLEKVIAAMDVTHATTRNTAVRLAATQEGTFHVEQVASLWAKVRGEWRYVNDPRGTEYFARASETIENEYAGDCDDFAIVLVSMVSAIGGEARLVMMDGPQGGHAYAEVCIDEASDEVRDRLARHYRRQRNRQRLREIHFRPSESCQVWLNMDWNAGVLGGPYEPEAWAVAIYPDGRTDTLAPAGQPASPSGADEAVPASAQPPGR
ncbi:MAG: transglutaminase-like domain-containing protein, partial [Myxococcales bacterium]|nr:transglutaminase-like domain-containing protein [Myxococcales bacterium]